MSIWGFCRRRYKLNQILVCKQFNTWSVAIICSKTSCCECKLYLHGRVPFKYNETLQTWMLVICKENTLCWLQWQNFSISFRFLSFLKFLNIDGTAEVLNFAIMKLNQQFFWTNWSDIYLLDIKQTVSTKKLVVQYHVKKKIKTQTI